tara:strand:- start:239 stop:1759 length:1521 start_codon:yes stop_codon:yes gene_type:complete
MSKESEFLKTLVEQGDNQNAGYQVEPDLNAPFPLHCLPDVLKETVEEYSRVKIAPIELTAAFAIGCYSVSLAKGVVIMTNYGEPTYPNLQIYGSAWSGIGKSVCILLQRPINEFETESREKFRMQVIEEIRNQRSCDSDQARAEPLNDNENKKLEEICLGSSPRIWTSNFSPEGLAMLLAKNGEFMSIINTDASSTIADMIGKGRNKGLMTHHLIRNGYSGDSYSEANKTAYSAKVDNPRIATVLVSTPSTMKEFYCNTEIHSDGSLSRFLIAPYFDDQKPHVSREPLRIDESIRTRWHRDIRDNLERYSSVTRDPEKSEPYVMEMETDARNRLTDFANEMIDIGNSMRDALKHKGLTDRVAENAGRIALNFGHIVNPNKPVTLEIVEDAIEVAEFFFARSFALALDMFSTIENIDDARRSGLAEKVTSKISEEGAVSYSDLKRLSKQDSHRIELRDYVNELLDSEVLVMWKTSSNKPSYTVAQKGWHGIPEGADLLSKVPETAVA